MGFFDGFGLVLGDVLSGKFVNLMLIVEQVFVNVGGVNGIFV